MCSLMAKREPSCLCLFFHDTNLFIRMSPAWPHLNPITSQRPHLNSITLKVKVFTFEFGKGHKHSVHSTQLCVAYTKLTSNSNNIVKLKVKDRKTHCININERRVGSAILISDKVDFRMEKITGGRWVLQIDKSALTNTKWVFTKQQNCKICRSNGHFHRYSSRLHNWENS
jgi:hypothetical protein